MSKNLNKSFDCQSQPYTPKAAAEKPEGPRHNWSTDAAIELCGHIEAIAPQYGCHVALTGGTLYKGGLRKDVDILFYNIRQVDMLDIDGLKKALTEQLEIVWLEEYGWVHKATYKNLPVDFFFPEMYPSSSTHKKGNY